MIKSVPIVFFFVLLAQILFAQEIVIDSLFREFKKDIELEQEYNSGRIIQDNETKLTYYSLLMNSPIDSLIIYTKDSNPAVRSLILLGLVQKGASDKVLSRIMTNHLNDTARFVVQSTCTVFSWKVNKYMQLSIEQKEDDEFTLVDFDERIERIKNEFQVIVPGKDHGFITRDSLGKLKNLKLNVEYFEIDSFTLYVNDELVMTSKNEYLTEGMIETLSDLKFGDRISFENILLIDNQGRKRYTGPVYLRII